MATMSDHYGANARFAASQDDDPRVERATDPDGVSTMLERWKQLSGQSKLCLEVPRQREALLGR
jgi:hypothetical protein